MGQIVAIVIILIVLYFALGPGLEGLRWLLQRMFRS
jgi:hypothetical protein